MMSRRKSGFLFCLFIFVFGCMAAGWAEFKPISDLKVQVGGTDYRCMLFPSRNDPSQWFCLLQEPRITRVMVDGLSEPMLEVFRYQGPDPRNPNRLIESGLIQCAFDVAPPDEVMERLKSQIPSNIPRPVKIYPMPLAGVTLVFKSIRGGSTAAIASPTPGIGDRNALRSVAFTVSLPTLDAGFLKTLIESATGVEFELSFNLGLVGDTPANQTFLQGLTGRTGMRSVAQAAAPGKPGPTSSPFGKPAMTAADRRNASIGGGTKPTGTPGFLDSLNKGVSKVRLAANGFMGLGGYPKEVRERRFHDQIGEDLSRKAFLILPSISPVEGLTIETIEFEVALKRGSQEFERRTFTWKPGLPWRDEKGLPVQIAAFPLDDLLVADPNALKDAVFEVKKRIRLGEKDVLEGIETVRAGNGYLPVSTPMELGELFTVDVGYLSWNEPETVKDRLVSVEIRARDGAREFLRFLKPQPGSGGRMKAPDNAVWLVGSGNLDKPGTVPVNIFFLTADGKRVPWSLNGRPASQDFRGGMVFLTDDDWRGR